MITGGTGFIGSSLALALASSGEDVHLLCRPGSVSRVPKHAGIRIFTGELYSSAALDLAMKGCNGVYHLAACTGVWYRDPGYHIRINREGTQAVLHAAVRAGVASVVITSTAGVTGPSQGLVPLTEQTPYPSHCFTQYEESKVMTEKMVRVFPSNGMRIVIVRPTRLYGPGTLERSNSVTRMLVDYLSGRWHLLPGTGRKMGNYAYISDVVKGHLLAMERGEHLARYHLGGEDMSYLDLFHRAGTVFGKQHRLWPMPYHLMLAASGVLKGGAFLTGREPAITPGWVKRYNRDWLISSRLAVEELGYTITPYEQGVQDIIKHYGL
jgi:nucleoside-diphosphate-sugar epimerase